MQAYTLLGLATAPPTQFGAAMATLTFSRQLGGSIGAAALGWLLLAVPDRTAGLVAVLAAAALVLLVALPLAPRRSDEPAPPASAPSGVQEGHLPDPPSSGRPPSGPAGPGRPPS
jgi:hypothetical protein